MAKVREVHAARRGTYDSPRLPAQRVRNGVEVGENRVARWMRVDGLAGRVRRRFVAAADSRHDRTVAPNTLSRELTAKTSVSVWCAEVVYIPAASGWVYTATIIDLSTRMIVGWSMGTHV